MTVVTASPLTIARPSNPIAFIDLAAQQKHIAPELHAAMAKVLAHGQYILGPEVRELEAQLAAFAGVPYAITCGSGTDALMMLLMAKDVGPGDAVFCPAFTFAATAETIALVGASPVFVDVCVDDFNMDPGSFEAAIQTAKDAGLTPKGVMPVDLFGQPARYPGITAIARKHGLWVLADAAQSFGALTDNQRVGAIGDFAATSFFPAKPLGCYGDGGAIFMHDEALRDILLSIRVHGQGVDKYENTRLGLTARMDTLQAAILIEKLKLFPAEIEARDRVAQRYNRLFGSKIQTPIVREGATSVWAQYTILVDERDKVIERLKADGVPTAIYYPRPLHKQPPYAKYPVAPKGLPVTEAICHRVLSLPMHGYLEESVQDYIIDRVLAACA